MRGVFGLRNPGADYQGTRHNLGYEVVDVLIARRQLRLKRGPLRVRADIATAPGEDLLVATNNTFMNEAGRSTRAVLSYYRVEATDLLVVHDDIDLSFGRMRIQQGGGNGGHNGVRSVEGHLGTRGFWRLKMGVGRPPGRQDPAEFVLRRFTAREAKEVDAFIGDAADVIDRWLADPARAQEVAAHRRPLSGTI
ncbi:MAG: aminoacyl-tRNA hydrolase [Actinomycetota bacterium]